ncbi:hypothetical protein AB0F91_17565 [Amycolatopsis sp. NPDC023774]|uniref:hypothetical protein n=1 Tax=Amycolatopsis sp. NPDC023774 TaxID=3155015 RepID=UPI0033C85CE2
MTWLACAVMTGSSPATTMLWIGAIMLGVVAPGVAVVRSCRCEPAALIEDVGWGAPIGCVVALLGWLVSALLPFTVPPWVFGPLVVLVTLVFPVSRARLLARPAPGWGAAPNLVMAGVMLVVIAWMTMDFLRRTPASPGAAGSVYYPDSVFQLAVVGQLRHAVGLTYPLVHGEPYSYQWFTHAILAHLLDSGADPFDVVVRLAPATVLPAVVLTTAVVARDVARRVWAGPIVAILLGVVGTTVVTLSAEGTSLFMVQTYWWASLTAAFGWLPTVAVAGCAIALIRGRGTGTTAPVSLLVPLAVLAAGAKPSNLAVLAGGAALAVVGALVHRKPAKRSLLALVTLAGVMLVALVTIYSSGDNGLHVDVLGGFRRRAAQMFPGLAGAQPDDLAMTLAPVPTITVVAGVVLAFGPVLVRLVGLACAGRTERRDPAWWFILGTVLAGVGAVAVLRHPGESEAFFLVSAYPVGLIGSAWGLSVLWERHRGRMPARAALIGGSIGALATAVSAMIFPASVQARLASQFGHPPTAADMSPLRQVAHYLLPFAVTAAILAAAAALAWVGLRNRGRAMLSVGAVSALLGTGLLSTGIYLTSAAPTYSQVMTTAEVNLRITADEMASGKWLAEHSGSDDVLAVNRVCTQLQTNISLPNPCTSKTFALAAISGRDEYVGGWAYASRNLNTAWEATTVWNASPFWDPAKLAKEQAAFVAPTKPGLDELYEAGVRWLIADSRGVPADHTTLDALAARSWASSTVTIWHLHE